MVEFFPSVTPMHPPSTTALYFAFHDGKLLLMPGEMLRIPEAHPDLDAVVAVRHYLGRLNEVDCWSASVTALPDVCQALPLRMAMLGLPAEHAALAGRAAQIVEWDRAHRYCGVCATPTEHKAGERARICPACKHVAYPRISPAMMALVVKDRQLLLGRSAHFPPGMYSALAGFVEPGESAEECVRREVREEVGLEVTNLRYFGSQSWPFPHSLMLAFVADWAGGEIVPQPGEIEDAQWFALDALPKLPPNFSIAGYLIRSTLAALQA